MSLFKNIYNNLLLEISKQDIYSKFYSDVLSQEDFDYITAFNPKKLLPVCKMILDSIKDGTITVDIAKDLITEINALPQEKDSRGLVPIQVANEMVKNGTVSDVFELKSVIENGLKSPISKMQMAKNGLVVLYDENGYRLTCTLTYAANNHYFGDSHWCTASDRDGRYDGYKMFCQYSGIKYKQDDAYNPAILFQLKTPDETYQIQVFKNGNIGQVCDYADEIVDRDEIISIIKQAGLYYTIFNIGELNMLNAKKMDEHIIEDTIQAPKTKLLNAMRRKFEDLFGSLYEKYDREANNFELKLANANGQALETEFSPNNIKTEILRHKNGNFEVKSFMFRNYYYDAQNALAKLEYNNSNIGKKIQKLTYIQNNEEEFLKKIIELYKGNNVGNTLVKTYLKDLGTNEIISCNNPTYDLDTKYIMYGDFILVTSNDCIIAPAKMYHIPTKKFITGQCRHGYFKKDRCLDCGNGTYVFFDSRRQFILINTNLQNPIVIDTINNPADTVLATMNNAGKYWAIISGEKQALAYCIKSYQKNCLYYFPEEATPVNLLSPEDSSDAYVTLEIDENHATKNVALLKDNGEILMLFPPNLAYDGNHRIIRREVMGQSFFILENSLSHFSIGYATDFHKYYVMKKNGQAKYDAIRTVEPDFFQKQSESDMQKQKNLDDNNENAPHMNEVKKKIDSLNNRIELL